MPNRTSSIHVAAGVLPVQRWGLDKPRHPVLLLHEALGSIELWRTFPQTLAETWNCSVFAYERQGHGRSSPASEPWPSNWLEQEATEVLPAVLDALGLERPLLMGHSDGGTLALQFAARFPERVSGVITLAAHVRVDERTLAGVASAGRAYRGGDLAQRLTKYHGANTDALFRRWHDTWLDPDWRSWSIEAELDAIRCPVLALQGAEDPYGLPDQMETIARRTGGDARLMPDCGHAPHMEAPEATLEAIASFLADRGL